MLLPMKFNFQGLNAGFLFHGKSAKKPVKLIYAESADLFAGLITNRLEKGEYSLLDLGSHKGEFLEDLKSRLNGYSFETVAVDVNESDLKENTIMSVISKVE